MVYITIPSLVLILALEQLEKLDGIKEAFAKFEEPMNRWSADLASIMDTLDGASSTTCYERVTTTKPLQRQKGGNS